MPRRSEANGAGTIGASGPPRSPWPSWSRGRNAKTFSWTGCARRQQWISEFAGRANHRTLATTRGAPSCSKTVVGTWQSRCPGHSPPALNCFMRTDDVRECQTVSSLHSLQMLQVSLCAPDCARRLNFGCIGAPVVCFGTRCVLCPLSSMVVGRAEHLTVSSSQATAEVDMSGRAPAMCFNLVAGEWRAAGSTRSIVDPLNGDHFIHVPDTRLTELKPFVDSAHTCPKSVTPATPLTPNPTSATWPHASERGTM